MNAPVILGPLALDPAAPVPLYRQLYEGLRAAILEGRLGPGARLPSSRALAGELDVGRNTVVAAFEQLLAEGYLEARVGAGTRVAAIPPETLLEVGMNDAAKRKDARAGDTQDRLSARGRLMSSVRRFNRARGYEKGQAGAFQHGLPALDMFPLDIWSRLLARRARAPQGRLYDYYVGAGYEPLRKAIAGYLGAARGVVCEPGQVIVTTGAQAALDLAARLVIDPGDPVWIEDPGYLGARGAFLAAGANLVPVPVDTEGLDIEAGLAAASKPKLIYVTPSHQFPLGATLSLVRRLALLETAKRFGAWVLEDDYDSEYRYVGRPLPALQGLDNADTVIYMGTFAKTLFPALRVGYLVVPPALVDAFETAIRLTGQTVPAALQAALADFIAEGHFGTHIRRMRALYAGRQERLLDALETYTEGMLTVQPREGGMQLVAYLPDGTDDRTVAEAAARHKVIATPLSTYFLNKPARPGLYLGYAAVADAEIPRGAEHLARALEEVGV